MLNAHFGRSTNGEKTPDNLGPSVGPDVSENTDCWQCQEWNPVQPSPYSSHFTDPAVANNVNKTVVSVNQGSSDGFLHTDRKMCRRFVEVVLFVLAVSGGGV